MDTKTQKENILTHLEKGYMITAMDALTFFGCFRLAARIKNLRDAGHDIKDKWIKHDNGRGYKAYYL